MKTVKRYLRTIKHAWRDSYKAVVMSRSKQSRLSLFFDIVLFSLKYEKESSDYMMLAYYNSSLTERKQVDAILKKQLITKQFRDAELAFHAKWTSQKWEHPRLYARRTNAYKEHFKAGEGFSVRSGVWVFSTHERIGSITIGRKVHLGKFSEIDYTGDLTIGNGVDVAERTIIFTHGHDFFGLLSDEDIISIKTRAYATPLVIEDNVFIGAQCIIMPGVNRIGENAVISAGSVVTKQVPSNTIVAGNPARIIGKTPARVYYQFNKERQLKK